MNDIKVQYLYDNCCNSLKIVNNFDVNYLKINFIEKITPKRMHSIYYAHSKESKIKNVFFS